MSEHLWRASVAQLRRARRTWRAACEAETEAAIALDEAQQALQDAQVRVDLAAQEYHAAREAERDGTVIAAADRARAAGAAVTQAERERDDLISVQISRADAELYLKRLTDYYTGQERAEYDRVIARFDEAIRTELGLMVADRSG